MPSNLGPYLVVMAVAVVVTAITVPGFRRLAESRGLVVEPDERRAHSRPIAQLGGGGMYVGFLAGISVAWISGWFPELFDGTTEPFGLLAAATLAYVVGLMDDLRELSAPAKIAGLVLVGTMLVLGGTNIFWFRVPFLDLFLLSPDLSYLLTVVWVLGLANAVNFIDGLDGLAAGIMGIGALAFWFYSLKLGSVGILADSSIGPLVAVLVVGICVGFLPWNAHPARVFMGDGGALLLGCLMAASTISVGGRTEEAYSGQTFFFYAPLAIPFVILGVPILDTAFAIIRRASKRQGLATADRDHLHHRLIRLGHGHRRSVLILWGWTALLSAFVLWPVYNEGEGDAIVPIAVVAMGFLLLITLRPSVDGRDELSPNDAITSALDAATDKPSQAGSESATESESLSELTVGHGSQSVAVSSPAVVPFVARRPAQTAAAEPSAGPHTPKPSPRASNPKAG